MGETARNQRARVRGWLADGAPESCDMGVYDVAISCINDADRLAEAEALLREARGWIPEDRSVRGGDREKIDEFLSGGSNP